MGIFPPRASWTSRNVSQQTAEKVFHAEPLPPSDREEAGSHVSRQDWPLRQARVPVMLLPPGMFVLSWVKGLVQSTPPFLGSPQCVSWPTVKKRTESLYRSAAASSAVRLFIPAILRGVYCILLCPEHRNTSPNSTSLSDALPPSEPANVIVVGTLLAGVAGRRMRHVPVVSTLAGGSALPRKVAVTD